MSFLFKYVFYYAFLFVCAIAYLPVLLVSLFFNYNINKFACDILFARPVMRKLWYSVSQFETANFTSPLYSRANNCFGMAVPSDLSFSVSTGITSATDGSKSMYVWSPASYYDLFLWLRFRVKCLDSFNAVAAGGTDQDFQMCVQLLNQYRFTTTPASVYYAGMQKYSDTFKKTYVLTLVILASEFYLLYLLIKYIYKHLKRFFHAGSS